MLRKWKDGLSISESDLISIDSTIGKESSTRLETEFQIKDTDDPEALLRAGSDSTGSCQRLDGDPNLNKGLLGCLLNGQTRYITVTDKSGKLMGRCLLRILWDEEQKKPALFREKYYLNQHNDRVEKLLGAMCQKRAEDLSIPIYNVTKTPRLKSLGGRSPFEYVDASKGIQDNSVYTIFENPRTRQKCLLIRQC